MDYEKKKCAECGKMFRPKRRDSDCCTPEEQTRYSNRRYMRERRESERAAKVKGGRV